MCCSMPDACRTLSPIGQFVERSLIFIYKAETRRSVSLHLLQGRCGFAGRRSSHSRPAAALVAGAYSVIPCVRMGSTYSSLLPLVGESVVVITPVPF